MHIGTCKLFSVIALNVLGVGLLMVSQNTSLIVRTLAEAKAILSEGSEAAATFSTPPVAAHLRFYFFDLQNLDEVREGKKPVVVEKGPYTYSIQAAKEMAWSDSEITYKPTKVYTFVESLSSGDPNDTITTLHPGSMAAVKWGDVPYLFTTATVDEFLFSGVYAGDESDPVGYFTGKNGTSEGTFKAFTGQGDIQRLNQIISVDGATENPCEAYRGTNGERFSPFTIPPPKVTFLNPTLCRPWDLHYSKLVKVHGLDCVRYENDRDFLSQTFNETLDKCFEEGMDPRDIGIRGIFDPAVCSPAAPLLYSLPHFLNADPKLLKDVDGLTPSETKHSFYLDVYPLLGTVQDMRVRIQVNFRLRAITAHPEIKETIYPVFWQEAMLSEENSDEAASIVFKKAELPKNIMFWSTLSVGALFILLAEVLLVSGMCSKSGDDDDDCRVGNDPYVTYNSRTNRSRVNW